MQRQVGADTRSAAALQPLLLCGWGETSYMCDLLLELDRGPAALARGCEVTLFSPHSPEEIKACLEETIGTRFWNIRLRPVQGNPLRLRELSRVGTPLS